LDAGFTSNASLESERLLGDALAKAAEKVIKEL